ncbi:hypothetical protein C1645_834564 [Glomus cerebriforme]|uniref:Uncharacterized protein n=1 Tax=Glomus cerebriforme TaxID=658196 RepID=A0A397SFC7_9GLOM|nr:hypothetical protein C1645_834564 [Glomus cerebriforme]
MSLIPELKNRDREHGNGNADIIKYGHCNQVKKCMKGMKLVIGDKCEENFVVDGHKWEVKSLKFNFVTNIGTEVTQDNRCHSIGPKFNQVKVANCFGICLKLMCTGVAKRAPFLARILCNFRKEVNGCNTLSSVCIHDAESVNIWIDALRGTMMMAVKIAMASEQVEEAE